MTNYFEGVSWRESAAELADSCANSTFSIGQIPLESGTQILFFIFKNTGFNNLITDTYDYRLRRIRLSRYS
jgi:hypothetical protein